MSAYRDKKKGTWYVQFYYTNWKGERKNTTKRGFETKREALQWENDFKNKVSNSSDMIFSDFVEIYLDSLKNRIKESTLCTKESIIKNRIVPYLGNKKLNEISSADVLSWQNEMMKMVNKRTGQPFEKSYLKTLHNQLSAILNFAVKYYNIPQNSAAVVGNMGTDKEISMNFWTLEQYKKFNTEIMEQPLYYYCFEVLYWTGIREGELLALTINDIDFENKLISINKTFHHLNGKDYVTSPKTHKSNRIISIPDFLVDELQEYVNQIYFDYPTERLFPITKGSLCHMLNKYSEKAELPHIRVHDFRHSHVSLLIDMGYSAVSIAERVGHESIDITYRYAHMFPTIQKEIASKLDDLKEEY